MQNASEIEKGLIEIKREETNFFTSMFVYDNQKKLPQVEVLKPVFENDEFEKKLFYVVYFKDIETGELLEFSVDRDSELVNKDKIKSSNFYLIEKMQEFVRINHGFIYDYYIKKINICDLTFFIEINKLPVTKSTKLLKVNHYDIDENYWFAQMLLSSASLKTKIYAYKQLFVENYCKCLLWGNDEKKTKIFWE